jgi:hypothetical protein
MINPLTVLTRSSSTALTVIQMGIRVALFLSVRKTSAQAAG